MEPRKPQRSTKGILKIQYDRTYPKAKDKYSIRNHVSTNRLSKSYACLVKQLSTISIPSNVHNVSIDPRLKKAINEEIEALQKNVTWEVVPLPKRKQIVGCSGYTQ